MDQIKLRDAMLIDLKSKLERIQAELIGIAKTAEDKWHEIQQTDGDYNDEYCYDMFCDQSAFFVKEAIQNLDMLNERLNRANATRKEVTT